MGGLLAENIVSNGVQFVANDANGNVVALASATNGATTANYNYGPFGELLGGYSPAAKLNPFTFQTEYLLIGKPANTIGNTGIMTPARAAGSPGTPLGKEAV